MNENYYFSSKILQWNQIQVRDLREKKILEKESFSSMFISSFATENFKDRTYIMTIILSHEKLL